MLTENEISHAVQFAEKLHRSINKLKLSDNNNKVLVSGACFVIAREHYHAIVCLIEEEIFPSAYALFRVAFEAYVRGEWLLRCADDEFVDDFIQKDKEPPKINCMIKELEERNEGFEGEGFKKIGSLSQIKNNIWEPSCGWTHTGGDAVRHWITKNGIESNYKKEDVLELLSATESIGARATMAIASLSGDKNIAEDILKAMEHHFSAQGERGG
ncbi:DUF6988 family protein [Verminephrobacter aporrectodeae]|uniref:DUF6988 family protein n=1 Tax=Verminephrobacter aporrectodeae TaxID=1110389 RepID=UPI0022440F86|nr:DUF5677 domain-containing protein [Verminephrobacter aporrectodeae]